MIIALLIILALTMWTLGAYMVSKVFEDIPFIVILGSFPIIPYLFITSQYYTWTKRALWFAAIPYIISIIAIIAIFI